VTERERTSMTRAALLLSGAAIVRFLLAPAPAQPPLGGRDSIADSLLAAGDSALEEKERRSRPFEAGETLDPNAANDEELDRLPGVGASRALLIVREREENGPYQSIDDLVRVPGIGSASVERMRPFLRVDASNLPRLATTPAYPAVPGVAADRGPLGGIAAGHGASPARIDINSATASQLEQLPNIGPVTASRIVAYRNSNGPFTTIDELLDVSGIGSVTLAKISPQVTVRP